MRTRKTLPKKIAVLMGGPGPERDVSLATGRGIAKALRSLGAEVLDGDVRDENFQLPPRVDLAFIALHGTRSGAGQAQKSLEARAIAYTGEGGDARRLASDQTSARPNCRA